MAAILIFACLLSGYGFLKLLELVLFKRIAGEPPFIRARTPIVGHILGLLKNGVSYYRILREKTKQPIFTIFLASQKVYIVNSPKLISLINRRQKVIDSNPPFLAVVFGKLFDFRAHDLAELLRNPTEVGSLRRDTKVLEHGLLERGMAPLSEIYTMTMSAVASRLTCTAADGPVTIKLHTWLREMFTLSTAQGVFGPRNPFTRHPELLDSFWLFESGLKSLTMGVFPSLTAAGPARARKNLVRAFVEYFDDMEDSVADGQTCELIRRLGDVARQHNRDIEYLGRYFFAVFSAFVLNTVPVIFWTIGHIVENPELLARVRTELAEVVGPQLDSKASGPRVALDVGMIREKCPLLISTLNEVLRCVGASTSTLLVQEDVCIDDQYLLTKGALVQITATAVHSDPNIWGSDVAEFNPERFLKPSNVHPSAFRTFGGGGTLCPGRHLASDEVLSFTVMFLHTLNAELSPDTPTLPRKDDTDMLSILKPKGDLQLVLSRRKGMEETSWNIGK